VSQRYDLLIIGGGMVGASLALALRGSGLRIAVIEAVAQDSGTQPSYDARAIALSHGSQRIFDSMGLWSAMVAATVSPIRHIQVSDRGHIGAMRMAAAEEGVEALGYVVEAAVIGRVLNQALADSDERIEMFCPARASAIEVLPDGVRLQLEHQGQTRQLHGALLVAADGGRSCVAEQLGGQYFSRSYGQCAIIANVIGEREHGGIAYERFTDSGPLALLPNRAPAWMADGAAGERRWSLVWTVREQELEEHLQLDDAAFLARLQQRLGRRAGPLLSVGPRRSYPLGLRFLRDHVRERLVFIGNAAHTLHPVAGQGFNLGLRDVACLAEVLHQQVAEGGDVGESTALQRYEKWRRNDYLRVMASTDTLARGFASNLLPLVVGRNLGLLATDLLPPLRRALTRQMMGLSGRQSRLARGAG